MGRHLEPVQGAVNGPTALDGATQVFHHGEGWHHRSGQGALAAGRIVETFQAFADAGFDELYVQQIGDRQAEFFDMLKREVLPRFA